MFHSSLFVLLYQVTVLCLMTLFIQVRVGKQDILYKDEFSQLNYSGMNNYSFSGAGETMHRAQTESRTRRTCTYSAWATWKSRFLAIIHGYSLTFSLLECRV